MTSLATFLAITLAHKEWPDIEVTERFADIHLIDLLFPFPAIERRESLIIVLSLLLAIDLAWSDFCVDEKIWDNLGVFILVRLLLIISTVSHLIDKFVPRIRSEVSEVKDEECQKTQSFK